MSSPERPKWCPSIDFLHSAWTNSGKIFNDTKMAETNLKVNVSLTVIFNSRNTFRTGFKQASFDVNLMLPRFGTSRSRRNHKIEATDTVIIIIKDLLFRMLTHYFTMVVPFTRTPLIFFLVRSNSHIYL